MSTAAVITFWSMSSALSDMGPTTTVEERAAAAQMRDGRGKFSAWFYLCDDTHLFFFFLSNFVSFYLIIITIGDGGAGKAYVDGLEAVEIDEGTFKYVLIEAEGTKGMRR